MIYKITKWFRILFGYKYKANHNSKEIHDISNEKSSCQLKSMTNYDYIQTSDMIRLLAQHGYNGCRWCYKKADIG